jgi:hypothetical protein
MQAQPNGVAEPQLINSYADVFDLRARYGKTLQEVTIVEV